MPASSSPAAARGAHIASLDGLRGLAVLLVLASHLSNESMNLIPSANFGGAGLFGVYLFFVLSSFLLTTQLLEIDRGELLELGLWRRYAKRRISRIFPLYATLLVGSFLCTALLGHGLPFTMSGRELVNHLSLQEGKVVYWTIPVEVKFYAILPIVVLVFRWVFGDRAWLSLAATALMTITIQSSLGPLSETNRVNLTQHLAVFLVGSLAAQLHGALPRSQKWEWPAEAVAWMCLAVIATSTPALWRWLTEGRGEFYSFQPFLAGYGVVWAVFILAFLRGKHMLPGILSSRPLRLLGLVSFSVYLWHMLVIDLVRDHAPLPRLAQAWLVVAGTLAISTASYWLIERPFTSAARGKTRLEHRPANLSLSSARHAPADTSKINRAA